MIVIIALSILLTASIIGSLICLYKRNDGYMGFNFLIIVFAICLFAGLVAKATSTWNNDIVKFEATRETINSQRARSAGVENSELTKTIIEENKWLASEQADASSIWWGWFSNQNTLNVKPIK